MSRSCKSGDWRLELVSAFAGHPSPEKVKFETKGLSGFGLWRAGVAGDDGREEGLWVRVRIETKNPIIRLSRDLAKGDLIRSEDLAEETAWQKVRRPEDICARPDTSAFLAMSAARPLKAGIVLSKNDVRRSPAVLREHAVSVEVRSGPAIIRVAGVALQDGEMGSRIRVLTHLNGNAVIGAVVGPGKVRVE